MVTGNDILGYKGQAYLGFNEDGNPVAPEAGNALAGVNTALDSFFKNNYAMNIMKYEQAIKDRDAARDTFASADVNFPMEATDRKALQTDYDKMREIILDDPTLKKRYAEMQQLKQDFDSKKAMAQTRYAEFAKQRAAIADVVDPQTRAKMEEHLRQQMSTDIYTAPQPYYKQLDVDPNKFFPKPTMISYGTKRDANGIAYSLSRTDPYAMHKEFDVLNMTQAGSNTKPDEARLLYNDLVQTPEFNNEENLRAVNKRLNEINLENGWAPGSKYFLQPIAKAGADGQLKITDNPFEFSKGMYFARDYHSGVETADKNLQTQFLNAAKEKGEYSDMALNRSRQGLIGEQIKNLRELRPYQIDKLKAEAHRAQQAGDLDRSKMLQGQMKVASPVIDAVEAFGKAQSLDNYRPVKELSKTNALFATAIKQAGIPDNAVVAEIPMENMGASKMLSVATVQNKKIVADPPVKMFAYRVGDDANSIKLVGMTRTGKFKVVDFNQGVNELIGNEAGYDSKKKVELESAAKQYMSSLQGGDATPQLGKLLETLSSDDNSDEGDGTDEGDVLDDEMSVNEGSQIEWDSTKDIGGVKAFKKGDKIYKQSGNKLIRIK